MYIVSAINVIKNKKMLIDQCKFKDSRSIEVGAIMVDYSDHFIIHNSIFNNILSY